MKTKEFIKLLQKEDPSGESYVRFGRGPVIGLEQKEGYWDGPYSYIEKGEDGKPIWVETTKGHKVDLHTMDIFDFAERFQGNWKEMKKHIRVEYTYLDDGERKKDFLEHAKKECKECKKMKDRFYKAAYKEMIKNAVEGWTWFQNKDVDKNEKPNYHKYYTWKIYDEKGEKQGSNVHNTESIMKSGKWEKIDNNCKKGYYQWIYIKLE
jgi:hypothetical protein